MSNKSFKFSFCIVLAFVLTYSFNAVSANDSTSYASSTGIEFTKNDNVSVESETLFLSKNSVQVEYEFYNHRTKKVSLQMAFPLPEIDVSRISNNWFGEPETWDFKVYINGKKYKNVKLEWRALAMGRDKAKLLKKMGISIYKPSIKKKFDNYQRLIAECLDYNLNKEQVDLLVKEELIRNIDESLECFIPEWNAQAVYLWTADFAPDSITKVKHTYDQMSGYEECSLGDVQTHGLPFCTESYGDEIRNAANNAKRAPTLQVNFYSYVIHTGGNWKGSIKSFKFSAHGPEGSWAWVEAPFPVKRISNNTVTANISNFKPISMTQYKKAAELESSGAVKEGEIKFFFYNTTQKELKN